MRKSSGRMRRRKDLNWDSTDSEAPVVRSTSVLGNIALSPSELDYKLPSVFEPLHRDGSKEENKKSDRLRNEEGNEKQKKTKGRDFGAEKVGRKRRIVSDEENETEDEERNLGMDEEESGEKLKKKRKRKRDRNMSRSDDIEGRRVGFGTSLKNRKGEDTSGWLNKRNKSSQSRAKSNSNTSRASRHASFE